MHSDSINTIVDLVEFQSDRLTSKTLYTFLVNDKTIESTLTYGELAERARAIGRSLQQAGYKNRPVLICFPPGLDFIEALFGCFYAGAIAVPIHFPHSKRLIPRISKIVSDSGAGLCMTTSANLLKLEAIFAKPEFRQDIELQAADHVPSGVAEKWIKPNLKPDDIAFLQYTSGSTNVPKGTVITHANLLSNLQSMSEIFEMDADMRLLSWLPATHDMGLVAGILGPPYCGAELILMSPTSFTENPSQWLKAITRFKPTVIGGPNFALDYCVERVSDADLEQIDLSSVMVLSCGGERIRAKTFEQFYKKFSQVGLRYEAMTPSYGMAEATVVISGYNNVETYKTATHQDQVYVSCGRAHRFFDLCIVDLDTQQTVPDGDVGEIWIAGPSVSSHYWGKSGADLDNFQQRLAGKPDHLFFRTGDLGFLKEGELYITGRRKDLIIYNGVNYYAPDIEQLVEKIHPAIATQGAAILPVDDGVAEHIIVLVELRRTHRKASQGEVAQAVQAAVGSQFVLPIQKVIFLKPGQLPRTSSGKISKHLCNEYYQNGSLAELGRVDFSAKGEKSGENDALWDVKRDLLKHEFAKLIGIPAEQVDFQRPIMQYGMDSLKLSQLNAFLKEVFGTTIPFDELEADSSLDGVLQTLPVTGGTFLEGVTVQEVPNRNLFERARQFSPNKVFGSQEISLPYFRELSSNEGTTCQMGDRTLLMFGSNNYLGLTIDPRVRQAAANAALEFGPSATGSRLLNGTLTAHRELEEKMAIFLGREDALVFTTGYQANIGLLSALLIPNSTLFVDEFCHASIYDGAFVANASVRQFAHNDPADLEAKMAHLPVNGPALVMIDGVYSMEGDIGLLAEIKAVAAAKNIPVLLDDAHSLGMIGATGRGTEEHFGLAGLADCISGTFSKSLASIGGWVVGEKAILDNIRYKGRSMIFSASMPPPAIAAASAALDILISEPERVQRLKSNAQYWRDGLKSLGFEIGLTETAVVPVLIGDELTCLKVNQALIDEGIYTNAALAPAVPKGQAILRTSVMATHTHAQMDQALDVFSKIKRDGF